MAENVDMIHRNATAVISCRQQRFIDDFLLFDDWAGRYQYLIDLGTHLRPCRPHCRSSATAYRTAAEIPFLLASAGTGSSLKCHFGEARNAETTDEIANRIAARLTIVGPVGVLNW